MLAFHFSQKCTKHQRELWEKALNVLGTFFSLLDEMDPRVIRPSFSSLALLTF